MAITAISDRYEVSNMSSTSSSKIAPRTSIGKFASFATKVCERPVAPVWSKMIVCAHRCSMTFISGSFSQALRLDSVFRSDCKAWRWPSEMAVYPVKYASRVPYLSARSHYRTHDAIPQFVSGCREKVIPPKHEIVECLPLRGRSGFG